MTALSVVVASQNARDSLARCLSSLSAQTDGRNGAEVTEIIVVDGSSDGSGDMVEAGFSGVALVRVEGPSLVPHLWAEGARRASGDVVAFTTAHFVPDDRWIRQTLERHDSDYAAVGGAIENGRRSSLTQWAVFFCRYAGYMLPFGLHQVRQVPGDNASYKRWVLDEYADLIRDGFWETNVNNRLADDGHALLMDPEVRVEHAASPKVRDFCVQRFIHGKLFGMERAENRSPLGRAAYLAASPLVPAVFLTKIARQVARKRRHGRAFLASLPLIALFVASWSAGEVFGFALESLGWRRGAGMPRVRRDTEAGYDAGYDEGAR